MAGLAVQLFIVRILLRQKGAITTTFVGCTSDLSNVCCPQQTFVPRDEFDSGYRVMSAIVGRMVAQWLV
jgi:hypothetical protein